MADRQPTDEGSTGSTTITEMIAADGVSSEDAFSVLGDRTRLAVLRALWEAPDQPVSFAELERRMAVETDNFSYHLDQLVGHFVKRTDEGYALRYPGENVMRAVAAGLFSESSTLSKRTINSRCPYCGDPVEMQYVDEQLTVRCTACGGVTRAGDYPSGTFMSYGFPPAGLVGRSPEEVLEAAHVLYDSKITPMMNGVCPECAGPVDHSFRICEDHEGDEGGLCDECHTRFSVWTEFVCELCAYQRSSAAWFKLMTEPAVIAFYHEHSDFDRSVPFSKFTWENAKYIRSISQSVVSLDPLRIRVDMPLEEIELRVTVNNELDIVSLEQTE